MQPETRKEFETELGRLVRAAYENDAVVSNEGYTLRHDGEIPDWEVVLVEVEKRTRADGGVPVGE